MPEIRVTRSAGSDWSAKFAPGAQPPVNPGNSVLTGIEEIVKHVGPLGGPSTPGALHTLTDVELENVATGDVLRWAENKWRNYPDKNITDGGNF